MDMAPDAVAQVPVAFCGPTADAAFFVALVAVVFGLYNLTKLLRARATETPADSRAPR